MATRIDSRSSACTVEKYSNYQQRDALAPLPKRYVLVHNRRGGRCLFGLFVGAALLGFSPLRAVVLFFVGPVGDIYGGLY